MIQDQSMTDPNGAVQMPMPVPDRSLYDSVLAAGFARYPERKENFERYIAASNGEIVDYLPIKLDVENVSRCNFHCTMCQVSGWTKKGRAEDMSFDSVARLIESQTGLIEVKIHGMGEPLLAATEFFRMIRFARGRDIWVRTSTNGSLLHLKDNYKNLVDSDICEIQISIDGATKSTYEKIRRGGKFERVITNCEKFNSYAHGTGRNRSRMWVVVQRENFHELDLFPELAARLGFNRLTLSLDINDWGQERWRNSNELLDMQKSFNPSQAKELVENGRQRGVAVTFWLTNRKFMIHDKAKLCPWPFERSYISSDMRVVPCSMIGNPQVSDLGDANDFTRVWNGELMRKFRVAHLSGDIPDYCKSCYPQN